MRRIQLRNAAFEGRNDVYVLDGERTTLVDTGIATPDVRAELFDGLADAGVDVADVDEVLLTHWHWDHSGLAGAIQAESGATVRVHEADASLVAGDAAALDALSDRHQERFEAWGMPADARRELTAFLESHADDAGDPVDVTPFAGGETFEAEGATLEAVHLPGHAAGLSAFVFEGDAGREAFVGDAVLPKYTPNVGGADVRVDRPLATYVESLEALVGLGLDRAWPGHRDVIDDPTARAATIVDHHRKRTARVVDVLRERGPCDAWTVSADLFGGLSDVHILHGPGEAAAHLDHLEAAGLVEREGRSYELVEPDPDVAPLFPALGETKP